MKKQIACEGVGDGTKSIALDQIGVDPATPRREPEAPAAASFSAVSIGRIVAIRQATALVDYPANTSGELVSARSLVPVSEKEIAREVALAFEDNDPAKPLILGLLQSSDGHGTNGATASSAQQSVEVRADEGILILDARKEIVLRCGKSSITLTSAGKVLIRGEYLLSRSSGVNRIKGGSVQIN
jgi:hypothetical protein